MSDTDRIGYGIRQVIVNKTKNANSFNIPKQLIKDFNLPRGKKYHVYYEKTTGIILYIPSDNKE